MKPIALILLFFCLMLFSAPVLARERMVSHLENDDMVLGTIEAVGRNSIEIYDEHTKTVKRFVYLDLSSTYHPGDRVRIYYHRSNNLVSLIKKMTVLDYVEDGQNLGYIMKNPGD